MQVLKYLSSGFPGEAQGCALRSMSRKETGWLYGTGIIKRYYKEEHRVNQSPCITKENKSLLIDHFLYSWEKTNEV
jgi:hypothetical protein